MRSATKIGVFAFLVIGLFLAVQASAIIFPCDFWCKPYKPCNTQCEEGSCGDYGCCIGNTWNCDTGFAQSAAGPANLANASWLPAAGTSCAPGAVALPAGLTQPAPDPVPVVAPQR